MAVGIKRDIRRALDRVYVEISGNASHGRVAAGLSAEGYAGGYRDALEDVLQALNGWPSSNSRYWPRQ